MNVVGNDRRMAFTSAEGYGYAWVVQWDDATEAEEFERAVADNREPVAVPLALDSVGDETTVLVSGPEAFVENATATGTAGNVTVAV